MKIINGKDKIEKYLKESIIEVFKKDDLEFCVERFLDTTKAIHGDKYLSKVIIRLNQAGYAIKPEGYNGDFWEIDLDDEQINSIEAYEPKEFAKYCKGKDVGIVRGFKEIFMDE